MTSILRQQRAAAFGTGLAAAVALYVSTKTYFWRVTEETAYQLPGAPARPPAEAEAKAPEPVLGAAARAWAVRRWNEGVDAVFKPVVAELSRRNL